MTGVLDVGLEQGSSETRLVLGSTSASGAGIEAMGAAGIFTCIEFHQCVDTECHE